MLFYDYSIGPVDLAAGEFQWDARNNGVLCRARLHAGANTPTRTEPKHYNASTNEPGIVATSANIPPSVAVRYPVCVGPGVTIPDKAILRGPSMVVTESRQVLVMGPLGSQGSMLTALFPPCAPPMLSTRCFTGTVPEFFEEVSRKKLDDPERTAYLAAARMVLEMAKARGSITPLAARFAEMEDAA